MANNNHDDLLDILNKIPVEKVNYTEWLECGMGLKHEGFSVDDWDSWSQRDSKRYHEGECVRKWNGFDNNRVEKVTSGTIVHIAESYGVTVNSSGRRYEWDEEMQTSDAPSFLTQNYSAKLIDARDVGGESFDKDAPDDAITELKRYLQALFRFDEHVCIVTRTDENGRPNSRGRYEMTREEVEDLIDKHGIDALGINELGTGAFACINPLDGEGREDKNVTDYRYALVESDELEPEKQLALIHELKLPCAAITWSGNKSVHAVVHIDAKSKDEYRERVAELYEHLNKNGFKTDNQNKNPSRLTRCPGFERNGGWQRLIEVNASEFDTWDEWQDWVVQEMTKLPDIENFGDIDELPELSPTIIDGVLRRKQKMLVVGPSKAGKSFLMIELAIAVAEGWEWFGHKCEKGRVLLVNFEIQRPSMLRRVNDVWRVMARAHGGKMDGRKNLDIWNLRGYSAPLDKITPSLVRRATGGAYDLIIIDPIYKVLTGDENSASDMAIFCNEFDKIAEQLECTVVYCHHHAKGDAGRRASMDRASGSGVFTRDPDAFLDMSPIKVDNDDANLRYATNKDGTPDDTVDVNDDDYFGYTSIAHPFRVSYTLREFATPEPTDVLFKWPIHEVTEHFEDSRVVGEEMSQSDKGKRSGESRSPKADKRWDGINKFIEEAYNHCPRDRMFTVKWCFDWMCENDEERTFDLNITENNLGDATKPVKGAPKEKRIKWIKKSNGQGKVSELVPFER